MRWEKEMIWIWHFMIERMRMIPEYEMITMNDEQDIKRNFLLSKALGASHGVRMMAAGWATLHFDVLKEICSSSF